MSTDKIGIGHNINQTECLGTNGLRDKKNYKEAFMPEEAVGCARPTGGPGGDAGKAVRLNSGASVNITNNGNIYGATS